MQKENAEVPLPPGAVRRNYWAFLFEGGFFVFGMGFVSAQTLLPALIIQEGGSSWLAAFMPTVMVIALFSVPMLNAGWVDGLPRLRPYMLAPGFLQRFVYVVVACLLVFGGFGSGGIVALLALAPILSGFLGGLGFSAWQRYYMAAVPPAKRASNLAFRFLLGGLGGVLAGLVIEWALERFPGAVGYGILHFWAAAFLLLSWFTLLLVPEPPSTRDEGAKTTERTSLRRFVGEFYGHGPQRRSRIYFAVTLFAMHGFVLLPPFYAVTLLDRLSAPASFLGVLAMWQMGGQAAGNLFAAWIGDRWGGRATCGFGLVALCLTVSPAPFIDNQLQAQFAYAAFTFSTMLLVVGKDTLLMEMSPRRSPSRYLSAMSGLTMVSLVFFGFMSKLLWSYGGGFFALVVGVVVACALAFAALSFVDDPRGVHITPLRAIRRGFGRVFR